MGRSCVVTRWKPELRWVATCGNSLPHTTFLRTHRPVRHLLISRAETQTVDSLYTSYNSLLCRLRPCNIRFAGHATLVTFHNQGTYTGSEQFFTGPTIKRHRSTGKLSRVHFPFMQLWHRCHSIQRLTTMIPLITWPLASGSSQEMTRR